MSEVQQDDILYIDEIVSFTPPADVKEKWCIKPKPKALAQEDKTNKASTSINKKKKIPEELRITPQTKPQLDQPAIINGRQVSKLEMLKPTTNLQELKSRMDNEYQRFVTRERINIYLERKIINRIRFEEIQKKKGREHTINFPEQFQARLKVKANGEIIFHHYHKRNSKKIKKVSVELCRSTGAENVQIQSEQNF